MRINAIILFSFLSVILRAQFPGPAGTLGTTAMHKDSSAFVAWGKLCNVTRGYQDISNTSLGYANVGDSSSAIGIADGAIVSLGDGGIAIVTFTNPIKNGPGFDLAVFENSFNDSFLELAFVEVSSDGNNYFRFPATSNSPTSPQYTNGAVMDASKIDNLAGKYRAFYGTPFDLQELSSIPQLDINKITHVKIIDVVGSITPPYPTYDKNNNIINDPWPTGFGSSGFDLDAVGVINQAGVGIYEFEKNNTITIYPNPSTGKFGVRIPIAIGTEFVESTGVKVLNLVGELMKEYVLEDRSQSFDISELNPGIYFICIENTNAKTVTKLIKE